MNKMIALVIVGLPVEGPFDYFVPEELRAQITAGSRVKILFNRQPRVGYVVGFQPKSRFPKLNPILKVLDEKSPVFNDQLLQLTKDLSGDWACSWGEAVEAVLPQFLRKPKVTAFETPSVIASLKGEAILLVEPRIDERFSFISSEIKKTVELKQNVLFLIPDKSVSGFAVQKLKNISSLGIWDSRLKDKEEESLWYKVKNNELPLVVGTRSAMFLPFNQLGLIVVYDEENGAYKQDQTPHYDTLMTVLRIAQMYGSRVLVVSSAPRAETFLKAQKEKWTIVLSESKSSATVQMIDLSNYKHQGAAVISYPLQNQIYKTLDARGRILLVLNQRGFGSFTRCQQCGFILNCERCSTPLMYLFSKKKMVCRHCNFSADVPKICPQCNSSYIRSTGTGIEKLESEVSRLFPQARVKRLDRDTENPPQVQDFDILIATQAVLKYKEYLKFNISAVLSYESLISRTDFRSAHHAFNCLIQLKAFTSEKLFIQTKLMDDYILTALKKDNLKKFYEDELRLRKELALPPYQNILHLVLRSEKEEAVIAQAQSLYELLKTTATKDVEVLEPQTDLILKLRDQFRWIIMLKSKSPAKMLSTVKKALKKMKRKSVIITVDPNA